MQKHIASKGRLTMGIDLGDRYSHFRILDDQGETVEVGRVATRPEVFEKRFSTYPPCRIALESGANSPWAARLLKQLGHEVLVANPRKLRAIYENPTKNDEVDADTLARIARFDPKLLGPIVPRSRESQSDRALLKARDQLVRTRTQLVNHVRGTCKAWGVRLSACSSASFAKQAERQLPEELRPALQPLLDTLADLTRRVWAYDRAIEKRSQTRYPQTQLLRQVPGVGPITALAFVLCIEDPARFSKNRTVGSFLGLRPKQKQSGQMDQQLRITKAGDRLLRRLLVGSAQYILGPFGPDSELRRFGLRIAERGGKAAKKRAVVAVARKLSVRLLALWKTGEMYDPFYRQATQENERAA
jgi:transposase